jgi:hypothetical protein
LVITKLMLFHRRAAGVSFDAWQAEWRHEFAPHLARLPGVRHVVQNVPRRNSGQPRLDGIDEVFWADQGAATDAAASPRLLAALSALAAYAAPGWPFGMLATERTQVPRSDGATAVRRMAMVVKRGDLNPATFKHEWDTVHPRFVAPLAGLRGYLQSVRVGCLPGVPAPDGSSTLWWDSIEACEAAYADTGPVGQAHVADMIRLFDGRNPTGTYCDAVEVALA